jgi:hypothetical protein
MFFKFLGKLFGPRIGFHPRIKTIEKKNRIRLGFEILEDRCQPSVINGSLASSDAPSHARNGAFADYYTVAGSGSTTLTMTGFDTYLYLYNSSLQLVAADDDSAGNYGSRFTYNLQSGQTYYIEATSYSSGVFQLTLGVLPAIFCSMNSDDSWSQSWSSSVSPRSRNIQCFTRNYAIFTCPFLVDSGSCP